MGFGSYRTRNQASKVSGSTVSLSGWESNVTLSLADTRTCVAAAGAVDDPAPTAGLARQVVDVRALPPERSSGYASYSKSAKREPALYDCIARQRKAQAQGRGRRGETKACFLSGTREESRVPERKHAFVSIATHTGWWLSLRQE